MLTRWTLSSCVIGVICVGLSLWSQAAAQTPPPYYSGPAPTWSSTDGAEGSNPGSYMAGQAMSSPGAGYFAGLHGNGVCNCYFPGFCPVCPKENAASGGSASSLVSGGDPSCGRCGPEANGFNNFPPGDYLASAAPPMYPRPELPSTSSNTGSLIDNTNMSYSHWGWDFKKSALDSVGLCRIHRPRDQAFPGSFGPGIFSNYDTTLTLSLDSVWNAELFDPENNMRRWYTYTLSDLSKLLPTDRQTLKGMTILTGSMTPVSSSTGTAYYFYGAEYVRAENWNGGYVLFKLFNLGVPNQRTCRPVQIVSNEGTTTITYKTWTPSELAASPSRALQIDTVTDRYGKQLTFSYGTTQVSGQWVVSSVTGPSPSGTSTRTYTYSSGNLASVTYPDSSTSTFTYAVDYTSICTAYGINDRTADVGHQKKTAFISLNSVYPQMPRGGPLYGFPLIPVNSIRMVTNANNEVTYLSFRGSKTDQWHYEGGGRLKNIVVLDGFDANRQDTISSGYVKAGWTYGTSSSSLAALSCMIEPMATHSPDTVTSETDIVTYDPRGVYVRNVLDSDGWIIRREYGDGTLEAFCYNAGKKIIRERDREGRVTTRVYNSQNQMTEERVGLVDHASNVVGTNAYGVQLYNRCATNDVSTAEYAVRKWEYVTSGNPGAGMVSAIIDELNNRTDFQYDSSGRLWKVLAPPDTSGGSRATTVLTYDSMGAIASVTDPEGHVVTFTRDYLGRITETAYGDGTTEKTEYGTSGNGLGLVVKTVDRLNVVTTYAYDDSQRLTTKVTASAVRGSGGTETATPYGVAVTETIQYVNGSDLVWKRTVNGATTEYYYDYRGRILQEKTFPRVGTTLTAYTEYDKGRTYKQTDPYGRATYFCYGATDSRHIRIVRGAVPEWAPPAPGPSDTLNSVLQGLTRDLTANAKFAISDVRYLAQGDIDLATDPIATQTTYTYDSRRRVTSEKRAAGTLIEARTDTIYDLAGNITELRHPRYFDSTDTNGYQKSRDQWAYNGRKLRATHTEAPGTSDSATESFTYDLGGHEATKTDFGSNVWTNGESGCCGLVRTNKDPLGHGTIAESNARGQLAHTLTISDLATYTQTANTNDPKILAESTTRYDARGRKTYKTTWLATRGVVDPANPPIAGLGGISLADGLTTQYLYDDNLTDGVGLDSSTGVSVPKLGTGGSGTFNVTLSNAITKLADTIANGGAGITFSSSSPGRASVVINPEDEISFSISDSNGRAVMSGQLNNYRGSGPTAVNTLVTWSCIVLDGTTSLSGYGTLLVTRRVDPLGYGSKSWGDGLRRTLRKLDALDATSTFTYNANGNLLSTRDPNSVGADLTYDSLGRNLQRTDTYGDVTTRTTYDRAGNILSEKDAKNHTTSFTFDARSRKKSTTNRISGVTSFAYTALGQLASLTDAESQVTSYTYDARGSKLTETYPDHVSGASPGTSAYGVVTFVYDNMARLLRKQDQLGDTCTNSYDRASRLTQRDYRTAANSPSGTIADSDTLAYDRAGRKTSAVSGRYANTVAMTYDPAGRTATESLTISSQTYTVGTSYNARGEIVQYTYPDNSIAERTYHSTGTLNQLILDGSVISTRSYDSGNRLTTDVLGNGITETRSYRTDNQLSSISYSSSSIGNLSYTWDANKNKTSEIIGGTMSSYGFTSGGTTYDNEDRLTGWQRASGTLNQSWTLSSVGDWSSTTVNGTATSRTHGPSHELLTNASQNVSTDVKGNITSIPTSLREAGASTALNLTWDFCNRMKDADVDANGIGDVSFKYDALGRRVARVASVGSIAFVYAGQQILADYVLGQSPSTSLYRYVLGRYVDEPIVRKATGSSGAIQYFHRNQQYSVTAITDASGSVAERYAYTAYGQPTILDASGTVLSGSALGNRYTYTGREWDADMRLLYFRKRWHSPYLGRFTSRDPSGYPDGANAYAAYMSTKDVDPFGTEADDPEVVPPSINVMTSPAGAPKDMEWYDISKHPEVCSGTYACTKPQIFACCIAQLCRYHPRSHCLKKCNFVAHFSMFINVDMLNNPETAPKTPDTADEGYDPVKWTYGHEQHHIQNIIALMNYYAPVFAERAKKDCETCDKKGFDIECERKWNEAVGNDPRFNLDLWLEQNHFHDPFTKFEDDPNTGETIKINQQLNGFPPDGEVKPPKESNGKESEGVLINPCDHGYEPPRRE